MTDKEIITNLVLEINALTKRVDELEKLSAYGDIVTSCSPTYVQNYLAELNKEVAKDD